MSWHINDVLIQGHTAAVHKEGDSLLFALNVRSYDVSADGTEYPVYRKFAVRSEAPLPEIRERSFVEIRGGLDHDENFQVYITTRSVRVLKF